MQHRERVLTALDHREPDCVPIDLSAHPSSGIAAMAYPRLREALDLPPRPTRVYDMVQQLAVVHEDVLDRLGADAIELGRGFCRNDDWWEDWTLPDGTPCQVPAWSVPEREEGRWVLKSDSGRVIAAMPDDSIYFEQTYWPFLDDNGPDTLERAFEECMWTAVEHPPGPWVDDDELAQGARRLRERSDRAITGIFGGNLLEMGQFLYRNDHFFTMLAGEPDRVERVLDDLVDLYMPALENYLDLVGEHIDIIQFGDDLGMQQGPLISPEMYRRFFKPSHEKMWRRAKELADVKVMLHSCGDIRPLLPDLIDAGLDIVNPVQIACPGMDAAGLKRDFGDDMVFWGGGCDTQTVLARRSPDQVKAHVKQQVDTLRPGGGFVFQQVHNIVGNVPTENILAMYEALHETT